MLCFGANDNAELQTGATNEATHQEPSVQEARHHRPAPASDPPQVHNTPRPSHAHQQAQHQPQQYQQQQQVPHSSAQREPAIPPALFNGSAAGSSQVLPPVMTGSVTHGTGQAAAMMAHPATDPGAHAHNGRLSPRIGGPLWMTAAYVTAWFPDWDGSIPLPLHVHVEVDGHMRHEGQPPLQATLRREPRRDASGRACTVYRLAGISTANHNLRRLYRRGWLLQQQAEGSSSSSTPCIVLVASTTRQPQLAPPGSKAPRLGTRFTLSMACMAGLFPGTQLPLKDPLGPLTFRIRVDGQMQPSMTRTDCLVEAYCNASDRFITHQLAGRGPPAALRSHYLCGYERLPNEASGQPVLVAVLSSHDTSRLPMTGPPAALLSPSQTGHADAAAVVRTARTPATPVKRTCRQASNAQEDEDDEGDEDDYEGDHSSHNGEVEEGETENEEHWGQQFDDEWDGKQHYLQRMWQRQDQRASRQERYQRRKSETQEEAQVQQSEGLALQQAYGHVAHQAAMLPAEGHPQQQLGSAARSLHAGRQAVTNGAEPGIAPDTPSTHAAASAGAAGTQRRGSINQRAQQAAALPGSSRGLLGAAGMGNGLHGSGMEAGVHGSGMEAGVHGSGMEAGVHGSALGAVGSRPVRGSGASMQHTLAHASTVTMHAVQEHAPGNSAVAQHAHAPGQCPGSGVCAAATSGLGNSHTGSDVRAAQSLVKVEAQAGAMPPPSPPQRQRQRKRQKQAAQVPQPQAGAEPLLQPGQYAIKQEQVQTPPAPAGRGQGLPGMQPKGSGDLQAGADAALNAVAADACVGAVAGANEPPAACAKLSKKLGAGNSQPSDTIEILSDTDEVDDSDLLNQLDQAVDQCREAYNACMTAYKNFSLAAATAPATDTVIDTSDAIFGHITTAKRLLQEHAARVHGMRDTQSKAQQQQSLMQAASMLKLQCGKLQALLQQEGLLLPASHAPARSSAVPATVIVPSNRERDSLLGRWSSCGAMIGQVVADLQQLQRGR